MPTPQTILIIDDDREISSTLSNVLGAAGYNVLTASNGLEGRKQIDTQHPDLVITDMMMPRMGGFPILEHLKSLETPPKVIMITANEGGRHKAYAEMLGAVDYLRKPFAMEVLLESVENNIGKPNEGGSATGGSEKLRRSPRKT
ncbi:MAG: response regulator [Planctomycetaceae bacterium]|nr:response regulator [Planctomycetaceae bacterium]